MFKRYVAIAAVLSLPLSVFAQSKPCEELKTEIAKKLEANGVSKFALEIMPKEQAAEGKVVGTCEGGSKKIVYSKTTSTKPATTTEPKKQ